MTNRIMRLAGFLILFLSAVLSSSVLAQAPGVPGNPGLQQATFTKAVITWAPPQGTAPDGYHVYRDGNDLGTTAEAGYTDTGLLPDTVYIYTVKAYAGSSLSDASAGLTVRTLNGLNMTNASAVQQVADSTDPQGLSAADLTTAVQDALEALGFTGVDFTQIDSTTFSTFVGNEMGIIQAGTPPSSETERATQQAALDQLLQNRFSGHSFVDMYLHSKLTELGESHWLGEHPDAAESLYELSLGFMSDDQPSVFRSLTRLASFSYSPYGTYATTLELTTALNGYRTQMMRFFDYFPDSDSNFAYLAYSNIAGNFFMHFPELLYYDNYDQSIYTNALQAASAAKNIPDSSCPNYDKIAAWELTTVTVNFATPDSTPIGGSLDVTGTNGFEVYPKNPIPQDIRHFTLTNGTASVPMYKGHRYDLKAHVNVSGGPDIIYSISNVQHQNGLRVTCDQGRSMSTSQLQNQNDPGQMVFLSGQLIAPYNLAATVTGSSFTLSWDWAPPSGNYTLGCFKVYRGGTEIGSTTSQNMSSIPLRSTNNTYTYTVKAFDSSNVASDESIMIEVLPPDFTSAESSYYAWKKKYFGNGPMDDNGDEDSDGLTNHQEFLLDSNPVLAPVANVKATLQDITAGLLVNYYQGHWVDGIPNFDLLNPVSSEIVQSPSFAPTDGNILGSGMSSFMGASFSGYFDAPMDGFYRFYLTSSDGSRLYLDGVQFLDNDGRHTAREYNADVHLFHGVHRIRIDYFKYTGTSTLKLEWAGPSFSRRTMGSSDLWVCTATPLLDETIAWSKDSDFDADTDAAELMYGPDPYAPDATDNQGLAIGQNQGTCTTILTVDGSQGTSLVGDWVPQGTALYAACRNGTVGYQISVANAGAYRLEIEGTSYNGGTVQKPFLLELLIDDSSCGSQTLTASGSTSGTVDFYLPQLSAGVHSAKINWKNVTSNTFLGISAVRLQLLGGTDSNSDGIPDWVDARNEQLAAVTVPATSRTSPLCVEGGNASNIEQISIEGFYTEPEQEPVPPVILHSVKNGWYSDVTLTPNAPSNLTIQLQNEQIAVNRTVTWLPTNILQDGNQTVRLNDSLLLTAFPENGEGSVSITVEGNTLTTTADSSVPYKFENAGDIQVSATFTPEGNGTPITDSITVKVVSSTFSGNPVCFLNESRNWDNPDLDSQAMISYDSNVHLFTSDLNPGLRLDVKAVQDVPGYVIARLGENGPVTSSAKIQVLDVEISSSPLSIIETFLDGSVLIEGHISMGTVPPDLSIYLSICVGGVTFEDGTINRWITAADFDEHGVYRYYLLRSPSATTGLCHVLMLYQDNVFLRSY